MDTFDLSRTSRYKVDQFIAKKYGGRYTRKEAFDRGGAGIGSLIYYESNAEDAVHYKSNIELLKNGVVLYFRDLEENRLLLFSFDEIERIELTKEADILIDKSYSIFKRLLNWGFSYHSAKIMLFEQEIISDYNAELKIKCKDYKDLVFEVKRIKPKPVIDFLNQLAPKIPVHIDMNEYVYLDKDF